MGGSFSSACRESMELAEKQRERERRSKGREEFNRERGERTKYIMEFPCPVCWFVPCPSLANVISKVVTNAPNRRLFPFFLWKDVADCWVSLLQDFFLSPTLLFHSHPSFPFSGPLFPFSYVLTVFWFGPLP